MAKRRLLKPGLVCRAVSFDIQPVKRSHKIVCAECGDYPEQYRLMVSQGAGRNAKHRVYCGECGKNILEEAAEKLREAALIMDTQYFHATEVRIRTEPRV